MDETPSNTSLLSFDLGSGLTPKMSWLASRTRDGLGPSALQRQGSGGESLGSLPSRDLLANLTDPISPSVAPYLQSLMSPREANALPAHVGVHSRMNAVGCGALELLPAGKADLDRNASSPCTPCAPGSYAGAQSTECYLCMEGMTDLDSRADTTAATR